MVGGGATGFPFVKLEENGTASFNHDAVTATIVERNAVTPYQASRGVRPVYSRLSIRRIFNATSVLMANLSSSLLFSPTGGWAAVDYTVQLPRGSFVQHQLTTAGENGANVLEVELEKSVSTAVLRATIDQSSPVI